MASCLHCKGPMPAGSTERFCCAGCSAVFALLNESGLERFYALAGDRLGPVAPPEAQRPMPWLEPLLQGAEKGETCTLELDVQGIRCAGCVWLMEQLYVRAGGGAGILVNPGLGRARLSWTRGKFDVAGYLRRVESFGYRFGPALKRDEADPLTWRLGVCAAIAVNVMLFSVSFYFGLAPKDGELFRLFSGLSLLLSSISVAVGGWPFFVAAWRGVRAGILHLDLPIALGIALVYLASLGQARLGGADHAYLDTLNVFITLMLLGRFLQTRLVQKNRRFLLEDGGLEGLVCRRVEGASVRVVPASAVREGDGVLVAPGELFAFDATLEDEGGSVSLDWISGESAPREVKHGETVPAGAFNAGASALHVTALQRLTDSALVPLLRQTRNEGVARDAFWNRLARNWAAKVLVVSAAGFLLWLPTGLERAVDVAAALLVVTCPCAIGLSIPLAYERVHASLRRLGFFARTPDLLDRLRTVRQVLFDKTGTLTLGRLELADASVVRELTAEQRDVAYNLACRSSHPASACLAAALQKEGAKFQPGLAVREVRGQGMELVQVSDTFDGSDSSRASKVSDTCTSWRLGRSDWATGETSEELTFSRDGHSLARFTLREALRPQAKEQVEELERAGYAVHLLSGDRPQRALTLGARVGISAARTAGGLSPEEKAKRVRTLDAHDTLYVGDGVNDAPAFAAAWCAGTPAVERPVMPSRSGFFFLGEGLSPLTAALAASQKLHRVVRQLLTASLAYNLLAVAAGLAGAITPLKAAIFMPLSSLSLLAFTAWSLREKAPAVPLALAPAAQEVT